jgi:hypothetical protein
MPGDRAATAIALPPPTSTVIVASKSHDCNGLALRSATLATSRVRSNNEVHCPPVAALIKQLDDDAFEIRERARKRSCRVGRPWGRHRCHTSAAVKQWNSRIVRKRI